MRHIWYTDACLNLHHAPHMVHTYEICYYFKSSITISSMTFNVHLGKDNNKDTLLLVYTSM